MNIGRGPIRVWIVVSVLLFVLLEVLVASLSREFYAIYPVSPALDR